MKKWTSWKGLLET